MIGFVPVDKPKGWTSHDVVASIRRASAIRKVGHAGTLDPMATGLLVVAVGPATRLLRYVQGADKEYVAVARLGVATDSLDADGRVVSEAPLPVTRAEVEAALPGFRGAIEQVPPMVSALKRDGKRLYELAREGKEVEREPRPVTIHALEVIEITDGSFPELTFRVACSKGTYVRTLADDLARSLGGRAHLIALRRTRIGTMTVQGAIDPTDLTSASLEGALVEPAEVLDMLPHVVVVGPTAERVLSGRPVDPEGLEVVPARVSPPGDAHPDDVAILDGNGRLLAVYRSSGTRLLPRIVLPV